MASSTTSAVYVHVIEDVINKVREEFLANGGPGDDVLNELQGLWEMKMMQAGAIYAPSERPPKGGGPPGVTPVHDLNVPYEQTEEYETPTAEMLFPPTPMQTPIQTPLPGTVDSSSMYNIPTGPSDYPTPGSNDGASPQIDIKPVTGRPSPYMQPPSPWMNQRPSPLGVDVNVAYVEGQNDPDRGASQQPGQEVLTGPPGKRKRDDFAQPYPGGYIPQQDGAGDAEPNVFELEIIQSNSSKGTSIWRDAIGKGILTFEKGCSSKIPQLDGPIPDPYDDMLSTPNIYNYQGVASEDYNAVSTPAPDLQASTPAAPATNDIAHDDDDEPPLNENDDDDLDDVDEGEELNTQHLVLAQFEKVTRTKSRWKCTLKDGIMHINNKDILFNKATGEFDF